MVGIEIEPSGDKLAQPDSNKKELLVVLSHISHFPANALFLATLSVENFQKWLAASQHKLSEASAIARYRENERFLHDFLKDRVKILSMQGKLLTLEKVKEMIEDFIRLRQGKSIYKEIELTDQLREQGYSQQIIFSFDADEGRYAVITCNENGVRVPNTKTYIAVKLLQSHEDE